MTVLVVGGGGIGLETFKALSSAGSWVTVYQRSDKFRKDIEGLGAMLAIGDVLDPAIIQKTFKSNTFDAVVVTVGEKFVALHSNSIHFCFTTVICDCFMIP